MSAIYTGHSFWQMIWNTTLLLFSPNYWHIKPNYLHRPVNDLITVAQFFSVHRLKNTTWLMLAFKKAWRTLTWSRFTVCKLSHPVIPTSKRWILLWVKSSQMSKHLHSIRGFLTHAQARKPISSGREGKKKFTHKATPARCASHYERSCCIFLGSYMLSFDTQRSHGVRDAPSHGNSSSAFMRCKIALLTVKSIKQRAGIQPNGLHWFTTTSQWFAARIFFLPPPPLCPVFILQIFCILHGKKLT